MTTLNLAILTLTSLTLTALTLYMFRALSSFPSSLFPSLFLLAFFFPFLQQKKLHPAVASKARSRPARSDSTIGMNPFKPAPKPVPSDRPTDEPMRRRLIMGMY